MSAQAKWFGLRSGELLYAKAGPSWLAQFESVGDRATDLLQVNHKAAACFLKRRQIATQSYIRAIQF
jgi:hypothetical protein